MEKYPHKVSGSFHSKPAAERALRHLKTHPELTDVLFDLLAPDTVNVEHRLQPETIRVRTTLVREHLIWGSVGLGLGLATGTLLIATGYPLFTTSALYTLLATTLGGLIFGFLFGGMLALRPDQGFWAAEVQDELGEGKWSILIHTRDGNQTETARILLRQWTLDQQETF